MAIPPELMWVLSILTSWAVFSQSTPNNGPFYSKDTSTYSSPRGVSKDDHIYDFIVVGGGTAGLTVATRLAQNYFNVAVIEAGTHYEDISLAAIPAAVPLPSGSDPETYSPIDWGFVTEEFPGANHRKIHYPRGKCLGGSSALSWMIYQRPTEDSMRQWAHAVNDSSYLLEETFPYYQRSVNFTAPSQEFRAENATVDYDSNAFSANNGGPVQVSYPNYAMPFSTWMKNGMEAIDIAGTKDFNSGLLMGAQYCTSTINPSNETRSSSDSFLDTFKSQNLTIYDNTIAQRILFNKGKRATGVKISGQLNGTLTARHEVIISAGAVQSPQLLMVSGIGPAETLRKHDIEVLVDSKGVGQNMWDHPFFAPTYRVRVDTFTKFANNLIMAFDDPNGPMSSPIADFLAWEKIPKNHRLNLSKEMEDELSVFPDDWPEAEYISAAGFVGNFSNLLNDQPTDGQQYASIIGTLVAPTSRGNITIKSANVSEPPIIYPNWLATKTDQVMAITIFKRIRQAFQSNAMAPIIVGNEYYPGPKTQSDEDILKFIKNNVMTTFHPACTCKMGTRDDKTAVLDNEARVFGTKQLRVIDASSFPILPPGHPQSTVYMLAEKIADQIIKEY